MVRVVLLDHLGLLYTECDIPVKVQMPQALIWGPDVFIVTEPHADGRPQYRLVRGTYVIPDTWTRP